MRASAMIGLLLLGLSAPAAAYKVMTAQGTGVELRWTSLPMKFNIHKTAAKGVSAAETQAAVRKAYQTWSNVSCSYYASKDMGVVNLPSGNDSDITNTNVWLSSWPASYPANALGITSTKYDPSTGKILDADTKYNQTFTWSVNGSPYHIDIQSVATHEIGHQLGLDHSQFQEATMFFATGQGNTSQRSLHSDDIAGICYLYPSGQPPPPECTSPAHCAPNETCQNNKCVLASKKGYGSPCSLGVDCETGICLQYGSNTFCSQQCDTAACPNGDKCLAVSGGGGVTKACLPGSANMGTKVLGDPCQTGLDCQSELCVSVPGAGYLCTQKCDLSQKNCPTSFYCASSTIGGLCIPGGPPPPPPPPPPKKKLGEPCTGPVDCESGVCAQTGQGLVCVDWCDPNQARPCPDNYICVPAGTKFVCVWDDTKPPAKGGLGASCAKHEDCQSNICGVDGDRRFCTMLCDPNKGCAEGYDCVPAGGDTYACSVAADGGGGCSIEAARDGGPSHLLLLLLLLSVVLIVSARRKG